MLLLGFVSNPGNRSYVINVLGVGHTFLPWSMIEHVHAACSVREEVAASTLAGEIAEARASGPGTLLQWLHGVPSPTSWINFLACTLKYKSQVTLACVNAIGIPTFLFQTFLVSFNLFLFSLLVGSIMFYLSIVLELLHLSRSQDRRRLDRDMWRQIRMRVAQASRNAWVYVRICSI